VFVDLAAIHTDTMEAAIGYSEVKVCFVRTAAIRGVFGVLVWMHVQRMAAPRRFC
jgi:hypothetical protein